MLPESVIIAALTAVPPTLVGVAGLVVSLRNSSKADSIHVLVNSNLHQVQSDLAIALHRITTLETVIAAHNDQ